MKKLFAFFVVSLLLFSLLPGTLVFAAGNTYNLSKLGLNITIPTNYSVITRDTPTNAPIFDTLGISGDALINYYKTNNIYLNAIAADSSEEIVVTMITSTLDNFGECSDTLLETLCSSVTGMYADYGMTVIKHELYRTSQTKFVKLYFTDTQHTVYGLQYYTVHDDKALNFTIRSYSGAITRTQENTIKAVVDSISLHKPIQTTTKPTEKAEPFVYKDTAGGLSFTVPANWKEEAFTEDRQFIDAKFVSTEDNGSIIIYGSIDLWASLTDSEKAGYSRYNVNNSFFTKDEIAEMYGIAADKISVVTYNGKQYYQGELTKSSSALGPSLTMTMTQLVCIENGWMYAFLFGGTTNHKYFSDFTSLLNSVQFPAQATTPYTNPPLTVANSNAIQPAPRDSDSHNNDFVLLAAAIAVVLVVIAILVVRKKRRERETYLATSVEDESFRPFVLSSDQSEAPTVCENCNHALPDDSNFCPFCGTRNRE